MPNEFKIGTPEQGEECEHVVCIPMTTPMMFPDNVAAKCSMCGCDVQHRPDIPTKPKIACMDCMLPRMEKAAQEGDLGILVTPKTLLEATDFISGQNKTRH